MRKIVLTFGLLSGAVSSAMMLLTVPFMDRLLDHGGAVIGYTAIVLSFLLVFFGIRAYRDNVGGGAVTFGRAFAVGLLIAVISSLCYVVTWEVIYFKMTPDFVDKYAAHEVNSLKAKGASQQQVDDMVRQMQQFKVMYNKPLFNAAITFTEPFPVGFVIALGSAAVLRTRKRNASTASASR